MRRNVVILSSLDWDFLWQGHHEIATRLARSGRRVLYVENTGIRTPGPRDAPRVARRLRAWLRALLSTGVRHVEPGLSVCSPLVLPPFGPSWVRSLNRLCFLPAVRRSVKKQHIRDKTRSES